MEGGRGSVRAARNLPLPACEAAGVLTPHPRTQSGGGSGRLRLCPALGLIRTEWTELRLPLGRTKPEDPPKRQVPFWPRPSSLWSGCGQPACRQVPWASPGVATGHSPVWMGKWRAFLDCPQATPKCPSGLTLRVF